MSPTALRSRPTTGSVSVVTFAVATATLKRTGIDYESHAALWIAVMESPGLIAGILLACRSLRGDNTAPFSRKVLVHDVLFGKSVLLLLGGLAIGAIAGEAGNSADQVGVY